MQKARIGKIICQVRKEKNITAKQLCFGLCQTSTLSYYENDERVPDAMTFYYFMRRLGVDVKHFAIMLNAREVEYFEWRTKTQQEIQNKNWDKLEDFIRKIEKIQYYKKNKIYNQYEYYLKALIEVNKYNNIEKAITLLEKAITQTVPDTHILERDGILLGSGEILLIIYYIYLSILGGKMEKSEGLFFLRKIEKNILEGIWNNRDKAEVYTKLVCVCCKIFRQETTKQEQLRLCENAIHLLVETKTLYNISDILVLYGEVLNEEKYVKIKKQNEIFYEIFFMGNIDLTFRPEIYYENDANIFVMNELLYIQRNLKSITQESLSENICETENYSRIETGKRIPSTNNFYQLAEKLDIGWGYFRGELDTTHMMAYQIRFLQREAIRKEDWIEAKRLIIELENVLDMDIAENEQYVKDKLLMAEFRLGECDQHKTLEQYYRLLEKTVIDEAVYAENYSYNQVEIEIMVHMAMLFDEGGETEKAIAFLKTRLSQMKQNRLGIVYQWTGVNFLLRELGYLYYKIQEYDKALECNMYVLQKNLNDREGMNLPKILDAIADDLEQMGPQYRELATKRYVQTFYVADFFNMTDIAKFMKEYYETHFEANIDD